jgi:hypothetical protein
VAFLRQVRVRDGRANQLVLWNSSELSARAVSQKADTIGVNDVDCVGRDLDQVPIFLFALAQFFFGAFTLGHVSQSAESGQKFTTIRKAWNRYAIEMNNSPRLCSPANLIFTRFSLRKIVQNLINRGAILGKKQEFKNICSAQFRF